MNYNNRSGAWYYHMAVFVVLVSMAALVLLYLKEYSGDLVFLVSVAVLGVFPGICIPLMKYLRKKSPAGVDTSYFLVTNFFAVFSVIFFIFIRLPEYIGSTFYFKAAVVFTGCVLTIAFIITLMVLVKRMDFLAFYIPGVIFLLYTLGTVILGGDSYYFLFYLVICGIGASYNNYELYCSFIFFSNAAILILVSRGLPLLALGTPLKNTLVDWIIAVYATFFFLILSRQSAEKGSRSARTTEIFNTLMDITPNMIVMLDEMNRITYISRSLAVLAHIENFETAQGRPIVDIFPGIDMKMVIGEIAEAEGFYENTVEIMVNGKRRYLRIISDQFPGAARGRFIDMSDITPIMEARVEAEEAKIRAEEANAAKSAFLAQMSHEIRTPMNAITGMSELILREQTSPAIHEQAEAVKQAANNLVAIVNDILDISKIESGKLEIIPGNYELAALLNNVITIIRMRLQEKPVFFVVNIDSAIPRNLCGDIVRIRQILLNLLSNAAKYTNQGYISLTVKGSRQEGQGITLTFEVADSGIGIKEEDLPRLFDKFTQMDIRANRGVEGTGLGLAIARSLSRIMGGDISVSSVYGQGSTFIAVLPQEIHDGNPFASVKDPETKRVLVYENREVYANSIFTSLENLGVPCKLVSDGKAYRQALDEESFDFIFVASALFDKAREQIIDRGIDTTLALLAEAGEVIARRNVRFIAMPAHVLSIANVLNNVEELRTYNAAESGNVRFTYPSAHVLIVDDIKTNLIVTEGLLAPYAMKIDTCLNGSESIRLVQAHHYDLMLVDHMMPGMDGIEVLKVIRALPGEYFQTLPIVILTANAIVGMRDMFLKAGFNDYISKPIDITKLNEIVDRWIPDKKKVKEWRVQERNNDEKTGESGRGGLSELPPEIDEFSPLSGLMDVGKGIAMTGGTGKGYRKVLEFFCRDVKERLPAFTGTPDEAGLASFVIHVHGIKSAARTIGAMEVSEKAAALETAGKAGDMDTIRKLLPEFCRWLFELVDGIGEVLKQRDNPGAGAELNPAEVQDIPLLIAKFSQLRGALEAGDIKDIERSLEELEKSAAGSVISGAIADLPDKILITEYQEAIDDIDRIISQITAAGKA
jgi:signal transduction histidine kinase/CheY-like chemotaxis protein